MKNYFFITTFILCAYVCKGQSSAVFSITNNGIAPIPAFNLGRPSVSVFTEMKLTKNLSFCPDFALDATTGKGWYADTWLRWTQPLDSAGRWKAIVGFDWSYYFQAFELGTNKAITQTVMYPTYQGKLIFSANSKSSFTTDFWYTYPISSEKEYGVKGMYISTKYTYSSHLGKKFDLSSGVNLFYINYSDGSNGFAASYDVSINHSKSGLFFTPQLLHSLSSQTQTKVKPNWNLTLGIIVPISK